MRRALLLLFFSAVLFAADFLLKAYVHAALPPMGLVSFFPYGGIGVFENVLGIDFSIVHVMNKGAAWGMFASFHEILFYGRVVIVCSMLIYLFLFAIRPQHIPLLMIITGALGNILDHLVYGHVIDMFYFRFWGLSFPVFNIADSAIFCGIALLMLQSALKKREKPLAAHD